MLICAAVKIRFERNGRVIETVVPGRRHSDCRDLMADLAVPLQRQEEDGFINHKGDFLDRYEAFEHAVMCGQISDTVREYKTAKGERQLYSEDMY